MVFRVCWITSQLSYSWAAGLVGECSVCLYVHVIYRKCDATQKNKITPHQEQPAQLNRVGVTLQEMHLMQKYMFQQWEHFKTFGCGLAYLLMRSKEKTLCFWGFLFVRSGFFFFFGFQPLTLVLTEPVAILTLDTRDSHLMWKHVKMQKQRNSYCSPRIT